MTQEEKAQYELYFDLFAHPGWKLFIKDIEATVDQLDRIQQLKTVDEMHVRQGRIESLQGVLNLETLMEQGYENAEAD